MTDMRTTTTALTLSILLVAGCSGEAPKPVESPPAPVSEPAPATEPTPAETEPTSAETGAAASDAEPVTPQPAPTEFATNAPEGSWRLVAFGDATEVSEVQVTLKVKVDGSVGGKSGCNSYAGEWAVEGGRARVGPLAGTKMACPAPQMEIETRYLKDLEKTAGWRTHVDGIVLVDPEGSALLLFESRPATAG
jgi:heat shock protein HslJ